MTECLRELRQQQERAHETIRSWPDYKRHSIIVTASNGSRYLLGDLNRLISERRIDPQPQLSGLINLLIPRPA